MTLLSLSISSTSENLNTYYVKTSYDISNPLWVEYLDDLTVEVEFYEEGSVTPFEVKTAYYSAGDEEWISSITLASDMEPIYVIIDASITIDDDLFSLEVTSTPIDLEYFPSSDTSSDTSSDDPTDSSSSAVNLLSLGLVMISMVGLVVIRRFSFMNKL